MSVSISPQGSVTAVRVISGPPQLREAAISAVRQWKYKPAMLNGQPAESAAEVQINFTR
jgi:periplasmic protein TonB